MTVGTPGVATQVVPPTPPQIEEPHGPIRDQKIAELEAEIEHLRSAVANSSHEIERRDQRILELENEIKEIEKELPKVRRPKGPPEPWKTGIFDCCADTEICILGTVVPCVLFGQNAMTVMDWEDKIVGAPTTKGCCGAVQTVGEGTKDGFRFFTNCLIHCVLGGAIQIVTCFFLGPAAAAVTLAPLVAYEYRTKIRTKYNLKETPMDDCRTSCFCHPCALCQEARELQIRGHGGLRKDLEIQAHANEKDKAAFEERVRAEERAKIMKEMGAGGPAPLKPEGTAPPKKK